VRLRYTLPALADLAAILDYIAAHSPQSARRVQARIKTLTDLLLLHPYIGRRTNDPTIRRMPMTRSRCCLRVKPSAQPTSSMSCTCPRAACCE